MSFDADIVSVLSPPDCIVHQVSMMDTLVGVAIKYGVEVADIKRMNGLVTDLQMYALKSLRIPLRRSHAPSCSTSNGHLHHEHNSIPKTPSRSHLNSLPRPCKLKSLYDPKDLINPTNNYKRGSVAMNTLQRYYGIEDDAENRGGVEMTVRHQTHHSENGFLSRNPKAVVNGQENGFLSRKKAVVGGQGGKSNEKSIRRRQKEENGNCDSDEGCGVRKSESTGSLQDVMMTVSKWNMSDFQALSGVGGMGKPFFDGLSKPIVGLWNKVARD